MNTWKTRGTARREAKGEKRIKCHLEFPLTSENTVDGILHRRKDNNPLENCQAIKKENYLSKPKSLENRSIWRTRNLQSKSRTRGMDKRQSFHPMSNLL